MAEKFKNFPAKSTTHNLKGRTALKESAETISSTEIAEMVQRKHNTVMRDIRTLVKHLEGERSFVQSNIIESVYISSQGRKLPCFQLTQAACELYATRMTGKRGTEFALQFILNFHAPEEDRSGSAEAEETRSPAVNGAIRRKDSTGQVINELLPAREQLRMFYQFCDSGG